LGRPSALVAKRAWTCLYQNSRLCYNVCMLYERGLDESGLVGSDRELIAHIVSAMPILADVSRSDVLLAAQAPTTLGCRLVAHASPHSSTPIYETEQGGHDALCRELEVIRAIGRGQASGVVTKSIRGAAVARQIYPVRNSAGDVIGALVQDAYWLAHERHRRRSQAFQRALVAFTDMVLGGELAGADKLDPFGPHDGIVYIGPNGRIQYMSGIALELYRRLGYRDSLVGRQIYEIDTDDRVLVERVRRSGCCEQLRSEDRGLVWVRKGLPVFGARAHGKHWQRALWNLGLGEHAVGDGTLLLVHDATEALRAQQELESQMALLREVHHRVKNNLQIVASILRMQSRRVRTDEAREVLSEGVDRILSVAVVHEFLSQNAKGVINLLEIARRIAGQVEQGLIDPSKRIQVSVSGPDIWLASERATQCALVINELVHNAIEHGLAERSEGMVEITLVDRGQGVVIQVADDGRGLPEGFDIGRDANLGLSLVRSMVERDLRGRFELGGEFGAMAHVAFEKSL